MPVHVCTASPGVCLFQRYVCTSLQLSINFLYLRIMRIGRRQSGMPADHMGWHRCPCTHRTRTRSTRGLECTTCTTVAHHREWDTSSVGPGLHCGVTPFKSTGRTARRTPCPRLGRGRDWTAYEWRPRCGDHLSSTRRRRNVKCWPRWRWCVARGCGVPRHSVALCDNSCH